MKLTKNTRGSLTITVFCPNCGTENRDEANVCSQCGNILPKLKREESQTSSRQNLTPADFGIEEDLSASTNNNQPPPLPPPPPPEEMQELARANPERLKGELKAEMQKINGIIVCERCGTVLNPEDRECPHCGKPYRPLDDRKVKYELPRRAPSRPDSKKPPRPYPYPSTHKSSPYPPVKKSKSQKAARCARCGTIVYDYETRCSNCGRILAPPSSARSSLKEPPRQPSKRMKVKSADKRSGKRGLKGQPPGTSRCGNCNAIVYPHQTKCPNCHKPLAPVSGYEAPYQRIARCRRCGHRVYPTDTVCPNCGRRLDPA